ncbi:tetratricopeptide repeat protein [Dokdonia sp.]|uniref:tetratricopeptide repeat protein n=1 Tax=Dokdonia sp. TaxID=2024995 RepID=UPI0032639658
MEEDIHKKIEAYLSKTMTEDEMTRFEKDIAANTELKEEVILYKSLNHHLTDTTYDDDSFFDSAYKKEIDTYIRSEEGEVLKKKLLKVKEEYLATSEKEKPKTRSLYYMLSAAAVIIVLFGLLFTGNPNTSLYNDYYQTTELPSFISRSDDKTLASKATSYFKKGDLDNSLSSFKEYIQSTGKDLDPRVYIYIGLIYSEKENLKEAISQFDLLEKSKSLDRSRALWYKALTYLKFDKISEAKETLERILKDSTNYKYIEAKELLGKL